MDSEQPRGGMFRPPKDLKIATKYLATTAARFRPVEAGIWLKLFVFALDNDAKVPATTIDLCVITGASIDEVAAFISRFEGDLIEPGGPGWFVVSYAQKILTDYSDYLSQFKELGRRGGEASAKSRADGRPIMVRGGSK